MRFSKAMRNRVLLWHYLRIGVRKLLRMGLVPARVWRGQSSGISDGDSSGQDRFGFQHGHAHLGGRRQDGQMEKGVAVGEEEADL